MLFKAKNLNWVRWSETEKVRWRRPSTWAISSIATSHPLLEIYRISIRTSKLSSLTSTSSSIWTVAWPSNPACTHLVSTAVSSRVRSKILTVKSLKHRKNKSRSKWSKTISLRNLTGRSLKIWSLEMAFSNSSKKIKWKEKSSPRPKKSSNGWPINLTVTREFYIDWTKKMKVSRGTWARGRKLSLCSMISSRRYQPSRHTTTHWCKRRCQRSLKRWDMLWEITSSS